MHADGPRGHGHLSTVDRPQPAGHQHRHHALRHLRRVMQQRIWLRPGHQGGLSGVSAVGEGLGHRAQAGLLGVPEQRRPRQPQQRKRRVVRDHGGDHGRCLVLVVHGPVVERPVRLDIAHPRTGDPGEPIQRPDLVDHVIGQARRIDVDAAAAEAGQVPVAHLGTDRHIAADGCLADSAQDVRVAGVEAAGDIGAGDDVQQGVVVPEVQIPNPSPRSLLRSTTVHAGGSLTGRSSAGSQGRRAGRSSRSRAPAARR